MPPIDFDQPRDGDTYDDRFDFGRLARQHRIVWALMRDGSWRTLSEISQATGEPEASVSARLRDFRKERFGGFRVERRRRGIEERGLFEYRLEARDIAALKSA